MESDEALDGFTVELSEKLDVDPYGAFRVLDSQQAYVAKHMLGTDTDQ